MSRAAKGSASASPTGGIPCHAGGACQPQKTLVLELADDQPQDPRAPKPRPDEYPEAILHAMREWSSKEDETAWRDL